MPQHLRRSAAVDLSVSVIALAAAIAPPVLALDQLAPPDHVAAQARSEWTVVTSTIAADLRSVSALAADDIWAVGDTGTVLHWDGGAWRPRLARGLPPGVALNAIAMVSPVEGWAVGDEGTIARWNGRDWATDSSPTGETLTALAMVSGADGWAVGWSGTILRWDGVRWSLHATGAAGGEGLTGVSMTGSDDGWAVGWFGTILRWDGSSWTVADSPAVEHLGAVCAAGEDDAWAVGRWGTILRWDGRTWSAIVSPTSSELRSVTVTASGEGWAVGQQGTILRWDGRWWQATSPTAVDLASVAIASASDACAVGSGGVILHRGTIAATATPTSTWTPTRTPRPSSTSTPTITPGPSPTPTATPLVRGSVRLGPVRIASCQDITVVGTFSATSAVAAVTEMRTDLKQYGSCHGVEERIDRAVWRPFGETESYAVSGGPHVYGAALGVQYRDALGNVSPAYCAEEYGVCMGTPTPPSTACADAYEPDDTTEHASALSVPGHQQHTICPAGDVDFVRFDACAGCDYLLTASRVPAHLNLRMQLFAADGASQQVLRLVGNGRPPAYRWRCNASGTYLLKVADQDPGVGWWYSTYELQIDLVATDTPTPVVERAIHVPLAVRGEWRGPRAVTDARDEAVVRRAPKPFVPLDSPAPDRSGTDGTAE